MSELGQKLINEIRMVAAGNPDYVYRDDNPSCEYVRGGSPSCLVGHGLWRLGLIDAEFETNRLNVEVFDHLWAELGLEMDEEEVDWVQMVQERQDAGRTWGEAVGIS
ncbi:hypothetical protein SEA_JUICYJAY_115 [Mycobacterium phage JuicyJay]|uniref:Uncharacterized protein n=2 Tax=Omegavirus courthouse TaxID=1089119 RepID=G8I5G5_9CAUD|nr:hypothetical protein CM09_gp108 [Mycobacterium phage Courthouse]YP_009205243.1 hypothetical protein AVT17_gp113 [Mycobacterium phage Ariel]YP_009213330.1 hypothetical protein AVV70_gp113 [Mycobacterium phage MiaZeal]ASZ74187.1 hypothetical protein SEA_SQUINT_111 [Mycobacterium phage Squint]ATS92952.1 hypothetical protein SEA_SUPERPHIKIMAN_110 [Mycobacterium phage Superphikiman]QBJ00069.1 hypothetical protein SEA_PHOEBUS_119 [Mycobacterium phage Phoebus]QDM57937.1 hypothetical protein SEA_N